MASNSFDSREGLLDLPQGVVYWRHDTSNVPPAMTRPILLFIHAGVTDHTLWDAQVSYFTAQGRSCLRYDLFSYGKSLPSEEYLQSKHRQPIDHTALIDQLVLEILPSGVEVIPIGLSIGGGLALSYTVFHPSQVAAAAIIAGGIRGIDIPHTAEEDALFEQADKALETGDAHDAAKLQVRIWGDGPLQKEGRMAPHLAKRMLRWNEEIATREVAKAAGDAIPAVRREPAPVTKLHEIQVSVAVAYGEYDETNTTGAMKYTAPRIKSAELRGLETAHMVNLEAEEAFNQWLGGWLERCFE